LSLRGKWRVALRFPHTDHIPTASKFYQAHAAPGVYAHAFLEGRLSATDLAHYRQ